MPHILVTDSAHPAQAWQQRGMTVIELIVAMLLFGTLGMIAVPQIRELNASFNRLNARSFLVQDLKRAQAESITQGCRGIFVIAGDGESYTFGCDFLTYDVTVPPAADLISFRRELPEKISIASSIPIIYNSRGQAVDASDILSNVTITLTDTSPASPQQFASGTLLGTGVFSYD